MTDGRETAGGPVTAPARPGSATLLGPAARVLHRLVRLYQSAASGRPSPCRYVPTCSMYALDALEKHGAWYGSWLTLRRLVRCHPWGDHGWDPVPQGKH